MLHYQQCSVDYVKLYEVGLQDIWFQRHHMRMPNRHNAGP